MHRIIEGIPKQEAAFLFGMAVEIAEKEEPVFTFKIGHKFFDRENLGLFLGVGLFVVSIQVVVIDVHSVVS